MLVCELHQTTMPWVHALQPWHAELCTPGLSLIFGVQAWCVLYCKS